MKKFIIFGAIGIVLSLLFACSSDAGTPLDVTATEIQPTATESQVTATPKIVELPTIAPPTKTLQPTTIVPQNTQEPTPTEDLSEQVADVPNTGFDPENTKDGMVMVYVPEGKFEMGTSDEQRARLIDEHIWDKQWNESERPVHTVYLDAFWIDQTEVTNGQYALCVTDGACQEPHSLASATRDNYYENPEYKDYPVVYINWYMAEAYCAWAGRRLPTEAEWEKAARGIDGRTYPWGEEIDRTFANFKGSDSGSGDTAPVGSYPDGASPYGVLDMAGNVWEWVADEFDQRYYYDSPSQNPLGPSLTGTRRVFRGGSWDGTINSMRTAQRYHQNTDYADFPVSGIRCAVLP